MATSNADVILLTKRDAWSTHAAHIARVVFGDRLQHVAGDGDSPFPESIGWQARGAIVLSFLSPWIVPAQTLSAASLALNFHPGPTAYPGIGCYNFALYDGAPTYGVVCHHMAPKVDSGAIVQERVFPIFAADTVETLKLRSMVSLLDMFQEIAVDIAKNMHLPKMSVAWKREPYTRADLDALCELRADMPADEIARRLRATTYPGKPGARFTVAGVPFCAPSIDRQPIA